MLPFLKTEASLVTNTPPIKREPDYEDEKEYDGLESAMEELHSALVSKDFKGAAACFRAAFDMLETQPHEEHKEKE